MSFIYQQSTKISVWLSPQRAARQACVCFSPVCQLLRAGQLPAQKPGINRPFGVSAAR